MKTLYIHGLDSSPKPEKITILKNLGLEVFALHIDYRSDNDTCYKTLKRYAQENSIEFIIGSSLGGFLGFYLSEDLAIPCLLFNPAMHFPTLEIEKPKVNLGICPKRLVVLGEQDSTVDPRQNWTFFKSLDGNGTQQRVLSCNWLAHNIDFSTFREMTIWALAALE